MSKLTLIALAASTAMIPVATAPAAAQANSAPAAHRMPPHTGTGVRHDPRRGFDPRMNHHSRRFGHVRRIGRGGMLPHFWFGPQFHVRNWAVLGFPQPMHGRRWVRHYDDAYLIDGDGRVHDSRHDWDWDRDRDHWDERDGIPVYVGDGDFEPGEWDYEWAEGWERGDYRDEYAEDDGDERRGPPRQHCGNPCTRTYGGPPRGYGQGGYGGYGYGYYGWGPVIVTETTVTTAPVVEMRTYYETVTEEVSVAPRKRRSCRCARPAPRPVPRPRPGERG
jgi:Ni/Co efflux regulator RcnB